MRRRRGQERIMEERRVEIGRGKERRGTKRKGEERKGGERKGSKRRGEERRISLLTQWTTTRPPPPECPPCHMTPHGGREGRSHRFKDGPPASVNSPPVE